MPDPIGNADGAERGARDAMLLENCSKRSLLRQIRRQRIARSADKTQDHDQALPQPVAPLSPRPVPIEG